MGREYLVPDQVMWKASAQRPARIQRFQLARNGARTRVSSNRGSGEIGAVLRRHGLYSSHLTKWREERKSGIVEGLAPQKRGPKSKANPLTAENQKLQRDNERLTERLRKAEIIIDVQKKGLCCWAFRSRKRRCREIGHWGSYADGRSGSRLRGLRFSSFFLL